MTLLSTGMYKSLLFHFNYVSISYLFIFTIKQENSESNGNIWSGIRIRINPEPDICRTKSHPVAHASIDRQNYEWQNDRYYSAMCWRINNSVTLKSGFIQGHSIVTIALFCIISEIYKGRYWSKIAISLVPTTQPVFEIPVRMLP